MSQVSEFKDIYKRFADALRYIMAKEAELKKDPERWAKIKKNFTDKFEKPMDEAWLTLPAEDKKRLAPLYLFRKAQQDPIVKEVMAKFDAKVVKVTSNEE
jgi:hypothetical protein